MKATEARRLSETTVSNKLLFLLTSVYSKVELETKNGAFNVSISIQEMEMQEDVIKMALEKLKSDGYEVTRNVGYDQREDTSWDSLLIKW